jgi:hypothetical protein
MTTRPRVTVSSNLLDPSADSFGENNRGHEE